MRRILVYAQGKGMSTLCKLQEGCELPAIHTLIH